MKSVLFKDWEVEAVLKGRKTQFRRVIKLNCSGRAQLRGRNWHLGDPDAVLACPYGKAGDMLWVRESFWLCDSPLSMDWPVVIYEDEIGKYGYETSDWYKSRTDEFWLSRWWEGSKPSFGHHPSVHMPRWASRIDLKIKSVRVERIQDVSVDDTWAEGYQELDRVCGTCGGCGTHPYGDPCFCDGGYVSSFEFADEWFKCVWDCYNPDFKWDDNPWVWAVEFDEVEK